METHQFVSENKVGSGQTVVPCAESPRRGKDTAAPYELGYDARRTTAPQRPSGDWQRDYKTKVNTALNKLDEWKELIEYASGLSK